VKSLSPRPQSPGPRSVFGTPPHHGASGLGSSTPKLPTPQPPRGHASLSKVRTSTCRGGILPITGTLLYDTADAPLCLGSRMDPRVHATGIFAREPPHLWGGSP